MARKFRSAESYYGNTAGARKNQRGNLVPGNTWQKRRIRELRLDCWWEGAELESKLFMFEGYENGRRVEDVPEKEMKSEKWLDDWWAELDLKVKKHIYWAIMEALSKEEKAPILEHTRERLERKLALMEKG
jgi:hypothetical protein